MKKLLPILNVAARSLARKRPVNAMWQIVWDEKAEKDFLKLDWQHQNRLLNFIAGRLQTAVDPRLLAEAMSGEFKGLWRFRHGDYRIIVEFQDKILTILILRVDHLKQVYR